MEKSNVLSTKTKKDYSKYSNLLMIVLLGFLVGTGVVCVDQLDITSITQSHPLRVFGAYGISTIIMGALYLTDNSNKKK